MIYKTLSTIVYNIWLMCINLEPTQPKYLFLRIFILFLKHYSLSVYFRCIFGSAILNSHKHLLFFLYFKIALGHRPLFSNAAFCVFLQASFVQSLSYIRELMIINNGKWKKKIYNEITNTFLLYLKMSIKQRPNALVSVRIMFIYYALQMISGDIFV